MRLWREIVDMFDSSLDTDRLDAVRTAGLVSSAAGLAIIGLLSLLPAIGVVHSIGAASFAVVTIGVAALVWRRYRIVQQRLQDTGMPTNLRETI